MPTYPLTFPSVGIQRSSFRLERKVGETGSPYTGEQYFHQWPAAWWEGEVTFRPVFRADAAKIQAFLIDLNGKAGTFLYGDPDGLALGLLGSGGTILVDGAGQTGSSLNVKGMTPLAQNVLKAGDYFQLGSGLSSRLYMASSALNADGAGKATITFGPTLRASPPDGDALVLSNPKTVMRSISNTAEWSSNNISLYNFTFAFRETLLV